MSLLHYTVLSISIMLGMVLDYWWLFWITLEMILWAMIPLLFNSFDNLAVFVFWQSVASVVFMVTFVFLKSKVCFYIILFKMGLPPFQNWLISLLNHTSWEFLLVFLFMSKLPYILVMMNCWGIFLFMMISIFPLIVLMYFWLYLNLKFLLVSLTISDYPWSYLASKNFFFILIYITLVILSMVYFLMTYSKEFLFMIFLIMTGLPPFSMFQVKLLILSYLLSLKILFFMIATLVNHFFIWVSLFSLWFEVSTKSVVSYTPVWLFMLMNFFWIIF